MNIIQDLLSEGQNNRPTTIRGHHRYNKIEPPKWITIHNAWSPWDAKGLNNYQKTGGAVTRPASWHLSCGDKVVVQGIPFGETAWHAGDYRSPASPGIGNTQSIGIEICDFYNSTTKKNDQARYLLAEARSVELVAHLIKTVPSLLPFPECVVPHTKWRPASGCPSRILSRKDGWKNYVARVGELLKSDQPPSGSPQIQRTIGIEVDGKMTNQYGYLINNRTFAQVGFITYVVEHLTGEKIKVTGHGDHIKIRRE